MHTVLRFAVLTVIWVALFGLVSLYVVRRSARLSPRLGRHRAWLWAVSAVCLGAPMVLYSIWAVPFLWRFLGIPIWVAHALFGLYMSFFLYLLLADLTWALARRVLRLPAAWGERVWAGVAAVSLLSALIGLAQVLLPVPVERVEVPICGLPPALEGLRIVQISDLHVGSPMRRGFVARVVRQANKLSPDLVVLTGDTVHAPEGLSGPDVEPLGELHATHGIFAVTGNHESHPAVPELARLGVRVLSNESACIRHDGAELFLVGLPGLMPSPAHDVRPSVEAALAGVSEGAVTVLLLHDPGHASSASLRRFRLVLGGHTHGGQFIPWSLVFELFAPYSPGLHRVGATFIYVSRGTGWWGPPNRFLVPAEMTVITLRAA